MNTPHRIGLALLAACLILTPLCAHAQHAPLVNLHIFSQPLSPGSIPAAGLVEGNDGNFYGTTVAGGANYDGTVFKVTPSGTLTTLYSFSGYADGAYPGAALVLGTDGDFYGTASSGGPYNDGTVFKITPSGAFTLLHAFNGSDASDPESALVQGSDGNFYGTTFFGGVNSVGVVFKITPAGAFTTLHSFSGATEGGNLEAPLVQGSDGNFYGTTPDGGAGGSGTVFKITPAGAFTVLYSFNISGVGPVGGLVQGSNGNFYGTTESGGTNGDGTIFKISPAGAYTTLYSFTGPDGAAPAAALIQGPDGNFYGTTVGGGAYNHGTVFKMTPAGTLTSLHSFNGNDGAAPSGSLALGPDGYFYSTTEIGGLTYPSGEGDGTVFKISADGAFDSLYSFNGGPNSDGANPSARLIQGSDGSFYGVAATGGVYGYGTVYKIDPGGTLTTLHSFDGVDGNNPEAALAQGSDGNFYGTTLLGGANNTGAIFQISPAGAFATLYSFSPTSWSLATNTDGAHPAAPLAQGPDGAFYGAAASGGANGNGTLFKITSSGAFTLLYTFSAYGTMQTNADGANPAGLVFGSDGNLYGTAQFGGTYNDGTIFRITPAGAFTTLHSFNGADGGNPIAALTPGPDGDFYGTTASGTSRFTWGTIFKTTPAGALTTIYVFSGNGATGAYPNSTLILGPDGDFYGTTAFSNALYIGGTVFKVSPSGALTTIYVFPGSSPGGLPQVPSNPTPVPKGVTLGSDGYLYGVTYSGGELPYDYGVGTVFRLSRAMLLLQNPATGQLASWFWNINYQAGGSFVYPIQNPAWKAVTTGDFNTDGQQDLLFQNPKTGQMAIWTMGNNYQMHGDFVYPTQNPAWKAVGVADFDGDGQPDILFQNSTTGQLAIWYMNGNYLRQGAFVYPTQDPAWKVVGVADFNADGQPDILFQDSKTGQLAIWYMNNNYQASAAFVYPTQNPAWQAIGIADVNWDGKPDILFHNTSTGKLAVWYMDNNYATGGALLYPALPAGWQVAATH